MNDRSAQTDRATSTLTVALPGVVSWSRPRRLQGRMRYPQDYTRSRDAWAMAVAHAVSGRAWRPAIGARYRVSVTVYGGGKRDLDRVCTAVLDALQAGGALHDDCLVDALTAHRLPILAKGRPATLASVRMVSARRTRPVKRLTGVDRSARPEEPRSGRFVAVVTTTPMGDDDAS